MCEASLAGQKFSYKALWQLGSRCHNQSALRIVSSERKVSTDIERARMTTRRRTSRPNTGANKPTVIAKAKVKRVARKAKGSLDAATHDAGLARRRGARKLAAKFEEAKRSNEEAREERRAQSCLSTRKRWRIVHCGGA